MSIKIKGLSKVTSDLKKFGVEGTNVIKRELDITATDIQRKAFTRAPARIGNAPLNIKQRIDKTASNGGLTVKVGIQGAEDLDGFIEFSTGLDFLQIVSANPQNYTPEILAVAKLFYKNGQGTLIGTPFLFPAFFEESPKLLENLKAELKKLAKQV
jgi:hypothetical protein